MDPTQTTQIDVFSYQKGGIVRRALAGLIDTIFVFSLSATVVSIARFVLEPNHPLQYGYSPTLVLSYVLPFIYEVLLLSSKGSTLGRIVMKIRVISVIDGQKPALQSILVRSLVRSISPLIANVPQLWALLDPHQQGVHDKLAKTVVVRVDREQHPVHPASTSPDIAQKLLFAFLVIIGVFSSYQFYVGQLYGPKSLLLVSGTSMQPTFNDRDRVYSQKGGLLSSSIQSGDVIYFTVPKGANCPTGTGCAQIKRVIGVPGDRIEIKSGYVVRNGVQLEEPYLFSQGTTVSSSFPPTGGTYIVPEDSYYVLGDHREHSSDSRAWGSVPENLIHGKVKKSSIPIASPKPSSKLIDLNQ